MRSHTLVSARGLVDERPPRADGMRHVEGPIRRFGEHGHVPLRGHNLVSQA